MNTHGRTRNRNHLRRLFSAALLMVFLTGCQTLQPGQPHPFTTLFVPDEPAEFRLPAAPDSEKAATEVAEPIAMLQQAH